MAQEIALATSEERTPLTTKVAVGYPYLYLSGNKVLLKDHSYFIQSFFWAATKPAISTDSDSPKKNFGENMNGLSYNGFTPKIFLPE